MSESEVQRLPLAQLHAHPDNPRLALREDVVERLVAEIERGGFGPEHAVLVRPIAEGFQVIAGHHRVEAARRVGLVEVPAWVREMDDHEAYMQLALSNSQGELTPLEIGIHALRFVSPGERKKGEGFKAYAERMGVSGAYVGQIRSAAKVYDAVIQVAASAAAKVNFTSADIANRATHLYEVSKADADVWPALIDQLVRSDWSVADTKHYVEKVREFDIPEQWADWLPLPEVVDRFLATREFSPSTATRLVAAAQQVIDWATANATDPEIAVRDFRTWLIAGKGGESWDRRQISDYHVALIRAWAEPTGFSLASPNPFGSPAQGPIAAPRVRGPDAASRAISPERTFAARSGASRCTAFAC